MPTATAKKYLGGLGRPMVIRGPEPDYDPNAIVPSRPAIVPVKPKGTIGPADPGIGERLASTAGSIYNALPDWVTGADVKSIPGPVYIPPAGKAGSYRKELAADIARRSSDDPFKQRDVYSAVQAGADFVPLMGEGVGVHETAEDIEAGNYGAAVLGGLGTVVGTVPIAGDVVAAPLKGLAKGLRKSAAGLGAVKKPKQEAITAVSLRHKPLDEAIDYARSGRHIIAKSAKQGGGFVGAPKWIKNDADLQKMRDEFDALTESGTVGADWYERTQKWIKSRTSDPQEQAELADALALFSAQADPDANLAFALQAINTRLAGDTPAKKVRTGQQARSYAKAFGWEPEGTAEQIKQWNKGKLDLPMVHKDTGMRGRIKLGKKTGIFGMHMDPTQVNPTTGTNDIWHARALGYTDDKGKPWHAALTAEQHAWMDAETVLAVARANEKKLGGRTDWTPGEIQAAPWVAGKAKGLEKKRKLSPEAAKVEAGKTYPEFEPKYVVHATHERAPGAEGHLPGLGGEALARYSTDPRAGWKGADERDVLYRSRGMVTAPTVPYQGLFKGEFSPGEIARPLGPTQGPSGERVMHEPTRRLVESTEALRAYADAQQAGASSMKIPGQKMRHANAYAVQLPENVDVQAGMTLAEDLGSRFGMPNVIHHGGKEALLTNFNAPAGISREQARTAKKELVGGLGAPGTPVRMEGTYQGYDWTKPGSDTATNKMLEAVKGMEKTIDTPEVRQRVLGRMQQDADAAAQTGLPIREDIQRAREIFSRLGFQGLRDALGKGLLPVAAVGIFLRYAEEGEGA